MMTVDKTLSLLRPNIANLEPYSAARNEYAELNSILLDANENPYNIWEEDIEVNRYPDPLQNEAKKMIASIKKVNPEQIFLGNGSDEAVDLIIRCFCEPSNDSIGIFVPTYGMYSVSATINNVGVKTFLLNNNFSINPKSFQKNITPDVKVIFICSPNNPTGNCQELETIEEIVSNFTGIVAVDEAYVDFSGKTSSISLLPKYPNLIVLQTFSKAWALAGIRVGVAIANQQIIQVLNKVKFPYNIGVKSLYTLEKALKNQSSANVFISKIVAERENVRKELGQITAIEQVYPSDSNFLLVKTKNAKAIYNHLLKSGIVVRNRSKEPLCDNCLRITVGTHSENQKLIETLKTFKL